MISPEALSQTREAMERHRRPDGTYNVERIKAELGLARSSTQHRIGLILCGEPIHDEPSTRAPSALDGLNIRKASVHLDAGGNVISQWVKGENTGRVDPVAYAEAMSAAFEVFRPSAAACVAPTLDYGNKLALYPWADPHFGLMVWGKECSHNWDLDIAVDSYKRIFALVIARTEPTTHALLCIGGDTLHADSNANETPEHHNTLDVDGRHQKVFLKAGETIAEISDMLLGRHEQLEVMVLPGNHDPTSAAPISYFLHAWFRNEPRVKVDISPSHHRFRQFGRTMLGFSHGDKAKRVHMAEIMAQYAPQMWGETVHRYAHTFHTHKDSVTEKGGVRMESHGVIAPLDSFAYGHGYYAGRTQKSIIYDRERGWCGEIIETT